MPDICMCTDKRCPSRTMCVRYTSKPDPHWQSYFTTSPRKKDAMRCSNFWEDDDVKKKT